MKKYCLLFVLAFSLFSCATKKQILYFQDADTLNQTAIDKNFEPLIEPNDILHIALSSMDQEVLLPFVRTTGLENNIGNNNAGLQGYLVSNTGLIHFPVLGDVAVAGKTRGEVETTLQTQLEDYVKDVVVDVRIMNFKITVLGQVTHPGVFEIKDERVTLPEAIGLAGDFTLDGNRNEVVIIREEDGKRKVGRIDFTQTDFFNSPFYFLKQNDVVYVEPSLKGVKKSGFLPDIPAMLSLVTIILSTVIILTR
ncbi:polysaccharide export outer membrane protein [Ulvibacter sp. MAR_2010_11]|uniref:polysaccharide biosynthesis/export family protein n=1 Tax=Ulvibacter sp. MAR_2010_11 TaxID=1250229 RepID=UPI000C2B9017|nr:polysaccharide biosynthesis/export family protein [Ulvibacter sp. MAR_2010_11]PKA84350.1 polysaccharide export outer membrane protein [Ulvibacter sp. MAR_2010_11]